MDTRGGAEPDWTKRYRLVAGVYAMRDGYILMLEKTWPRHPLLQCGNNRILSRAYQFEEP
jgi:hypothetical protein